MQTLCEFFGEKFQKIRPLKIDVCFSGFYRIMLIQSRLRHELVLFSRHFSIFCFHFLIISELFWYISIILNLKSQNLVTKCCKNSYK